MVKHRTHLYQDLHVIRHFIARVLSLTWLDLQQPVHFLFIESYSCSNLCQALVRIVSNLVGDRLIEELRLLVEEGFAEVVEFFRCKAQYGRASFVDEGRRWMPGLDLLAEDELDFGGVLLLDKRYHGCVDGIEHLLRERTDIVEVWGYFVSSHSISQVEMLT